MTTRPNKTLNKPREIAGPLGRKIDDIDRLIRQYGGTASEWYKLSTWPRDRANLDTDICASGESNQTELFPGSTEYDIHWYERRIPGQEPLRYEFKLKPEGESSRY